MIHLKGLVSHTDKYGHAFIVFMSDYHHTSWDEDHTRKILRSYDKIFKSSIKDAPDDVDKMLIKSPLKNKMYTIIINKAKYQNLNGEEVTIQELKTREVLITATLKRYTFFKKNKKIKEMIVGWKIDCTNLKII